LSFHRLSCVRFCVKQPFFSLDLLFPMSRPALFRFWINIFPQSPDPIQISFVDLDLSEERYNCAFWQCPPFSLSLFLSCSNKRVNPSTNLAGFLHSSFLHSILILCLTPCFLPQSPLPRIMTFFVPAHVKPLQNSIQLLFPFFHFFT